MANPLTIDVIGDKDVVTAAKDQPYVLVVHGTDVGDSGNNIKAATLTVKGGKPVAGKIRKEPVHWAVSFEIDKVDVANPYSVHVEDSQTHKADRTFRFQEPKADDKAKNRFDPQTGSTVPGSGFYVYGNSNSNLSTYCYMNQPGGFMYVATNIEPSPNYVFYFHNIPAGTEYSITVVVWSNSPRYYYSTNITVD
jgi:hypothetical protein